MTGDVKHGGSGRWGLGRWFSPSRPPAIDPTTPAPPPDIVSSPSYHPPNTSFREDSLRSGPSSEELYPPPQTSGYTTAVPQPPPPAYNSPGSGYRQEEALYPPPHPQYAPNGPQSPLSGTAHGLGHSFHQVADPMGSYSPSEPPHPPQDYGGMQHGSSKYSGRMTDENEYVVAPGNSIQVHGALESGYLLHGTLEASVYEAVSLPNMDMFSERVRLFANNLPGPLEKLKKATGVHGPTSVITSDPYTVVVVAGARVARTRVISNNANPKWNEHFLVPVAHHTFDIVFVVKDQDVMGSQRIGQVKISAGPLLNGGVVDGWYDLLDKEGKPCHAGAKLRVSARYIPVEQNVIYSQGVGSAHGVANTYFPMRKGCRLTLYQDAHVYDHTLPNIMLDGGIQYAHGRCWEDICSAINDAQHLIYITGWSVWDKVALVRDANRPMIEGGNLTLGELLKKKASQGVRVLLLLWDDKSSHDLHFVKTSGVMNTFDEETKKFFKNTGVRCVLAPRYGASKTTWFRQRVVGTLYTHHQKCVIVDSGPYGQRRLSSFVGGLDLTAGRWDTPSHYIFASLQREHKDDFRNKSWEYAPGSGGPREPWHDLHCKIEGHAAYDVLTNFEQRWRKATPRHDDELIDIDRHEGLWGPSNRAPDAGDPALFVSGDQDPETWHVQIFRSIDSGSVKGFPTTVDEVHKENLVWGKSVAIDISIQMAYINAIRCAQHFIYIENQYFLGSSYNWPDYTSAGANHIIPMELALKICSKIREGKRFAVYIVVPMWPEGVPDSAPVQEILYFQSQTMKMMYGKVADALREVGASQAKPTDYLNFYCLGTKETVNSGETMPLQPPDNNSKHGLSQINRRMMIYVHAKGMVVDDELVIMGSANINQRSMDGSRDTEIAMGGYQPYHTWVRKNGHPRGQVWLVFCFDSDECYKKTEKRCSSTFH
ncbi:hypothetical protein KC19_8G034600 [Ceratodon purpureus]|uniref:phospholipase D n=1 Tax=Ceratodon purpureus TaxID=3225 RepID=A0A8T0GWS0_CERPU|nr:hypothetical protein KC19_8G034600 [Ceratodon purpureus]